MKVQTYKPQTVDLPIDIPWVTDTEIRKANLKMVYMVPTMAAITLIDCFIGIFRKLAGRSFIDPEVRQSWRYIWRYIRYMWRYFWNPELREVINEYRRKARGFGNTTNDQLNELKGRIREFEVSEDDFVAGLQFTYAIWHLSFVTYVLVTAIIAAGSVTVWKFYPTPNPAPVPVVEKPVEFTPTEADVQDTNYGPWLNRGEVFDKVADPKFVNMAKVDSTGTIQYSETVTNPNLDGFKPLNFHERVINPTVVEKGQIRFHDNERNTFTVNPGQVFIFEGYKSKAFYFDQAGKLYGIDPKDLKLK
jgi:hypothetical protein